MTEHLCPECMGVVPPDARRCMHCGQRLGGKPQITQAKLAAAILIVLVAVIATVVILNMQEAARERERCNMREAFGLLSDEC